MTIDKYTFSEEDIKLFLDETLEMLEVLEEEVIKLEEEGEDPKLLQDMFRIAHTVKGSAGTIGHNRMADLAHSMEDILSKLRDGEFQPNQDLVNVLLDTLDALKSLATEVMPDFEGEHLDTGPYLVRLRDILSKTCKTPKTSIDYEAPSVYEIFIEFNEDTVMPAVRALQVLQVTGEFGTVIDSKPTEAQISQGEMTDSNFFLVLESSLSVTPTEIIKVINDVPDVKSV